MLMGHITLKTLESLPPLTFTDFEKQRKEFVPAATTGTGAPHDGRMAIPTNDQSQVSAASAVNQQTGEANQTTDIDRYETAPTVNKQAKKNSRQIKDPRRDTGITFDEMNRLMNVYGPIRCLYPRPSRKVPKPESTMRKFYRWFPDLRSRFIKTPEGCWTPKAGHEAEIKHRLGLGIKDEQYKRRSAGAESKCHVFGEIIDC